MTLEQLSAMLDAAAVKCKPALELDLVTLGEVTAKEAKAVIGTYGYGWPQLTSSTQSDRVAKGFSANDPLLRTGHMRDTIRAEVAGLVLAVGSPDKVALWQELGTSRGIPPRPFLSQSMMNNLPLAANLLKTTALKLLTGAR